MGQDVLVKVGRILVRTRSRRVTAPWRMRCNPEMLTAEWFQPLRELTLQAGRLP